MTDLKFGPSWLRQLSDGANVSTPPPTTGACPKYKLAEFRYGKEEMLELCRHVQSKIPSQLEQFPDIVVSKQQDPLIMQDPSEEEMRLILGGVNSGTVRMSARGGSVPRGLGRGGMERGRGRGRGRGDGGFFRDDDGFGRGRSYNRSESWDYDRERSFGRGGFGRGREDEDDGARREISRGVGRSNWRDPRQPDEEDEGSWRKPGPKGANRLNWRDPRDREGDYQDRGHGFFDHEYGRRNFRQSSYNYNEEELPEWSLPDADEEPQGCFEGGHFFTEKDLEKNKKPWRENSEDRKKEHEERHEKSHGSCSQEDGKQSMKETVSENKKVDPKTVANNYSSSSSSKSKEPPKAGSARINDRSHKVDELGSQVEAGLKLRGPSPRQDVGPAVSRQASRASPLGRPPSHSPVGVMAADPAITAVAEQPKPAPAEVNKDDEADFTHLETATMNLISEDPSKDWDSPSPSPWPSQATDSFAGVGGSRQASAPSGGSTAAHGEQWFYKDPQNETQGPFSSGEMMEWFSAGYFTMTLLVKRNCDDGFIQLGELIKKLNKVPFGAGVSIPPMKNGTAASVEASVPPLQPSSVPTNPAVPAPAQPAVSENLKAMQQQEQLRMFMLQQQQQQQQQQVLGKVQQIAQLLQQHEAYSKMAPAQVQEIAYQLYMKQQMAYQMQQQGPTPVAGQLQQSSSGQLMPEQPAMNPLQSNVAAPSLPNVTPANSRAGPVAPATAPSSKDPSSVLWRAITGQQASGQGLSNSWGPNTVWELEASGQGKSVQELEREHLASAQREQELRRRQQEEESKRITMLRQQEEERLRQEEQHRRLEEQRMLDERRKLDEQRVLEEQRKQQEEQRQREEQFLEEQRRAEERLREERRRLEEERRKQEEMKQEQRRMEMEKRKLEEQRRIEEHMRTEELRAQERKQQEEEMERKKEEQRMQQEQELIRRQREDELQRKEAEERRRLQQQQALQRLQQQQEYKGLQLPEHAKWGSANGAASGAGGGAMSLAEIQAKEAAEQERLRVEQQKHLQEQREQLELMRKQQENSALSWSAQLSHGQGHPLSLNEIQVEQARGKESKLQQQMEAQLPPPQVKGKGAANVPWNATSNTNWAHEGAWGTGSNKSTSFWESGGSHAPPPTHKKTTPPIVNNKHFPDLSSSINNQTQSKSAKTVPNKPKKNQEEDAVRRLFQKNTVKDDLTLWCERELSVLPPQIDLCSLIGLLMDIQTAPEIADVIGEYLGDPKVAQSFAKKFVEKRKNYQKSQPLNSFPSAGPILPPSKPAQKPAKSAPAKSAPAKSAPAKSAPAKSAPKKPEPQPIHTAGNGMEESGKACGKKKHKKGGFKNLDSSLLGFRAIPAQDRVNIGEIDGPH